jgi:hypothetical protein
MKQRENRRLIAFLVPFIQMLRLFRKYHKWFGLIATVFILFFAVSGIILNHRNLLSGIDG